METNSILAQRFPVIGRDNQLNPVGATKIRTMNAELATRIAISGLGYIANDEDKMGRFLALTGLTVDDLRGAAQQPGFLVGVLDFFMGFEPTLLKFAEASNFKPQEIVQARQFLAGPEEVW